MWWWVWGILQLSSDPISPPALSCYLAHHHRHLQPFTAGPPKKGKLQGGTHTSGKCSLSLPPLEVAHSKPPLCPQLQGLHPSFLGPSSSTIPIHIQLGIRSRKKKFPSLFSHIFPNIRAARVKPVLTVHHGVLSDHMWSGSSFHTEMRSASHKRGNFSCEEG